MAQKQGSSKKSRAHKVSEGKNGGGGKVQLTDLEKVLMNGGMGHFLRKGKSRAEFDKTKAGKRRLEEARVSATKHKTAVKGANLMHSGKLK